MHGLRVCGRQPGGPDELLRADLRPAAHPGVDPWRDEHDVCGAVSGAGAAGHGAAAAAAAPCAHQADGRVAGASRRNRGDRAPGRRRRGAQVRDGCDCLRHLRERHPGGHRRRGGLHRPGRPGETAGGAGHVPGQGQGGQRHGEGHGAHQGQAAPGGEGAGAARQRRRAQADVLARAGAAGHAAVGAADDCGAQRRLHLAHDARLSRRSWRHRGGLRDCGGRRAHAHPGRPT
mmetsp:Transcript_99810/g.271325  ORF Transcript_99810/g.271325 Transcript_99810/m.271325 type:complete len:232 (-) Transcript_99810:397-1092(-)